MLAAIFTDEQQGWLSSSGIDPAAIAAAAKAASAPTGGGMPGGVYSATGSGGSLITDILKAAARAQAEAEASRNTWMVVAGILGISAGVGVGWFLWRRRR